MFLTTGKKAQRSRREQSILNGGNRAKDLKPYILEVNFC